MFHKAIISKRQTLMMIRYFFCSDPFGRTYPTIMLPHLAARKISMTRFQMSISATDFFLVGLG